MKLLTPLLAITLLALAAAPCAHAQASPAAASEKAADSSAITAKLKQMEDAWAKALLTKDTPRSETWWRTTLLDLVRRGNV